jgi:hypothetical protein
MKKKEQNLKMGHKATPKIINITRKVGHCKEIVVWIWVTRGRQ